MTAQSESEDDSPSISPRYCSVLASTSSAHSPDFLALAIGPPSKLTSRRANNVSRTAASCVYRATHQVSVE